MKPAAPAAFRAWADEGTWLAAQERMRREDSFVRALLVEQDDEVALLVSLWPTIPVHRVGDPPAPPPLATATLPDLWAWAWACTQVRSDDVEIATGFSTDRSKRVVEQARRAGLIYPDGSISKFAKLYIENKIRNTIPRPKVVNVPPAAPAAKRGAHDEEA